MEGVGLAIGLLGLFNNVLDCFEYVHLSRNFGKSYQISLLKLDNARLRLSRWGSAIGLSGGVDNATSLRSSNISEADIRQAEQILGQIISLFADTEKTSGQFKKDRRRDDPSLLVHDEATDLDPQTAFLHQKMRNLSIMRQNRTRLWEKVKWALYTERHFKDMVENITSLTNDLVELFPDAREPQQRLCNSEVLEFSEPLRTLSAATKGQDVVLVTALSDILEPANEKFEWLNNNSKVGSQIAKNTGPIQQTIN